MTAMMEDEAMSEVEQETGLLARCRNLLKAVTKVNISLLKVKFTWNFLASFILNSKNLQCPLFLSYFNLKDCCGKICN